MCGIAGLIVAKGEPFRADAALARAMARALAHRGPDGEGVFAGEAPLGAGRAPFAVALGHRRLAVIDTSPDAAEPLPSEDGGVQVVFNGEIYNHRALRAALAQAGHRFRSRTDAEALVHLVEERGPAALPALRGMFAFAALDRGRGRLVLARDPAGKKPLYYSLAGAPPLPIPLPSGRRTPVSALLFASEPAALFAAAAAGGPGVPRDLDRDALEEYLAVGYIPAPRTAFRAIQKLEPGTMLIVEAGALRIERYARFADPADRVATASRPAAGARRGGGGVLRRAVVAAVRARLESDVPLGAFLSGGIDSTIVAGLLAREAGGRVATFSIGFDDPRYDETRFARIAAARFGTEHAERRLGADAYDALPGVVFRHGEPFADESAVATHHLAALARSRVTVALTGDGGDELFLGYRHQRAARALAVLDRALPAWARRRIARLMPPSGPEKSLRRQAGRLLGALGEREPGRYLAWAGIFPERGAGIAARIRAAGGIERYDLDVYLPDDILAKVDRATMAHGLEARAPLLDDDLARLAVRIAPRRKSPVPWRGKKALLDAFRDLLPPEIAARPKMGFGVPVGTWFRGPLRALARDVLLSGPALSRGLVSPEAVRALLDDHEARRAENGRKIHALLAAEAFFRQLVDPPEPTAGGW
jgi:asparagine synthase (glutamine-hydrolysing)